MAIACVENQSGRSTSRYHQSVPPCPRNELHKRHRSVPSQRTTDLLASTNCLPIVPIGPTVGEVEKARKVIQDIRREQLVDKDIADPDVVFGLGSLKATLQRSIEKLSHDIYAKRSHFLLELVQNADDNCYQESAGLPTVSFCVGHACLVVGNNEIGFTEENIRALCDVGRSTKAHKIGYIGEKGVGFKSVFKYTNEPHVFSRGFAFKFTSPGTSYEPTGVLGQSELGFIVPRWLGWENNVLPEGVHAPRRLSTTLYLPARLEEEHEEMKRDLKAALQPHLLLFLRKLQVIEIYWGPGRFRRISRIVEGSKMVISEETSFTSPLGVVPNLRTESFELCRHQVAVPTEEELDERRTGAKFTEIVIAFPLADDGHVAAAPQSLFAFLPVRSYGFAFVVQADFLLVTSREAILLENSWNRFLRDAISGVFLEALTNLFQGAASAASPLACEYFSYLRMSDVSESFFKPVLTNIFHGLRNMKSVPSVSGSWCRPCQVVLPDRLCQDMVSNEKLLHATGCEYVAPGTRVIDYDLLRDLGCVTFSLELLCACVGAMDLDADSHSEDWYIQFFGYIMSLDRSLERKTLISNLRIFPRLGGLPHASLNDMQTCPLLFQGEALNLLVNMGLNVLAVRVLSTELKAYLQLLGVRKPSYELVIRECILPVYQERRRNASESSQRFAHLQYIKLAFESPNFWGPGRKDIIAACREHLTCEVQQLPNSASDGQVHRISDCFIRTPELEHCLKCIKSRYAQTSTTTLTISCVSELYFVHGQDHAFVGAEEGIQEDEKHDKGKHDEWKLAHRKAWENLFKTCGATLGLKMVHYKQSYHYGASLPVPADARIPRSFRSYEIEWPQFAQALAPLLDDRKPATVASRMELVSLIDRVWDDEYEHHLCVQVISHYMGSRECIHQRTQCTECTTATRVDFKKEPYLSKLDFVKTLRNMMVSTRSGDQYPLKETFCWSDQLSMLGEALPFVSVPLQSPGFMRACAVSQVADTDAFLKALQQMAHDNRPPPRTMDRVCRIYWMLDKIPPSDIQKVRDKFEANELILAYDCSVCGLRWFSTKSVRWRGADRGIFDGRLVFLSQETRYADLQGFFVDTLGVQQEVVVKDFVDILRYCRSVGATAKGERDRVYKIYNEFSWRLRRQTYDTNYELHDSLAVLKSEPLFLTHRHGWIHAQNGPLVPDSADLLDRLRSANMLHQVQVLDVPANQYYQLKSFFEYFSLDVLSAAATPTLASSDGEVLDTKLTEHFQRLVPGIARLLLKRCQLDDSILNRLAGLRIFTVPYLAVGFDIKGAALPPEPKQAFAFVEDSRIYVDAEKSANFKLIRKELASELCKLVGYPELHDRVLCWLMCENIQLDDVFDELELPSLSENQVALLASSLVPAAMSNHTQPAAGHAPQGAEVSPHMTVVINSVGASETVSEPSVATEIRPEIVTELDVQGACEVTQRRSGCLEDPTTCGDPSSASTGAASSSSLYQGNAKSGSCDSGVSVVATTESKSSSKRPTQTQSYSKLRRRVDEPAGEGASGATWGTSNHPSEDASNACWDEFKLQHAKPSNHRTGMLAGRPCQPNTSRKQSDDALIQTQPLRAEHILTQSVPTMPAAFRPNDNQAPEPLRIGDDLEALFYGEWHPGQVRRLLPKEHVEVLWDAEETVSHVHISEVRRKTSNSCKPKREVIGAQVVPRAHQNEEDDGDDEESALIMVMQNAWSHAEDSIVKALGLSPCVEDSNVLGHVREHQNGGSIRESAGVISAAAASTGSLENSVGKHVRMALHDAGRRYLHDARLTVSILKNIYVENNGPHIMCGQRARHLRTREARVPVSQIRYSHNQISSVFGSGPHAGLPLTSLIDDLREGRVQPHDDRIRLKLVCFKGHFVSLHNRRLYALKQHASSVAPLDDLFVPAMVFDLCPITAKFILSYSTPDNGLTVEMAHR